MNIECRIVENRDIQVNDSFSPSPVWKMDLYIFMHDKYLLYTYDRCSLIWFTHKYCICLSHGNDLSVLCLDTLPPLNMKCVQCLDPEFDTANQYDCALLCNYTHNICTLHMISWPTMHFGPLQNMSLCTHPVRHMTHIKMFWSLKSSQTCVTWPLWGGRKGMSSNKPTIAPSPIGAVAIFKSYRLLKTNIVASRM